MVSRCFQFRMLVWKNVKVCWPSVFQIVKSYACSYLMLSILVIVRSAVRLEQFGDAIYTPFKLSMPILSKEEGQSLKYLIYSPWSPILEKIMTDVCKAISDDEGVPMGNYALEDRDTLEKYLSNSINMNTTLAGVQFDDSLQNASHLPPRLNVTFRFPGTLRIDVLDSEDTLFEYVATTWETYMVYAETYVPGPRGRKINEGASPSYHAEGFLKLQQVVAYSAIKHWKQEIHNQSFTPNRTAVVMQRYPHPAWNTDDLRVVFKRLLGSYLVFGVFMCYMVKIMVKITEEQNDQLKESMKSMGLPNWLHWLAWFTTASVASLIVVIPTLILLKVQMKSDSPSILVKSDAGVFLLLLMCYVFAQISFCFALSVFFPKPLVCEVIYILAIILSSIVNAIIASRYSKISTTRKFLYSLFFPIPFCCGCQMALEYEDHDEGLQWNNLWRSPYIGDNYNVGSIIAMLILDAILYMLLTLYVEQVFPGKYGVPQPWYFPFLKRFWCPQRLADHEEAGQHIVTLSEFYERDPENLPKGIDIQHLRKEYPGKVAVNDLTLSMYKDQITVLLGHNGAGKTTTIAMLTGITYPTSGKAFVAGYDITTSIDKARESMGFCPQEDILFRDMSVRNNLYFFTALKGVPRAQVQQQVDYYLRLVELKAKEKEKPAKLSGGMKRKLCLAIALSGGSTVVMLDEPTSGMDPVARRNVWAILQKEKRGRSILLTTHAMDEADVLGDRIAIMTHGQLQCCGSSFFLKKKYGAGNHLIMEVSPKCRADEVTAVLQKYIPDIQIANRAGSELSYVLSDEYRSTYGRLLQDIESRKKALEVLNYGITCTTLEEVFLKLYC